MFKKVIKFLKNSINLLFPPKCVYCGKIVEDYDTLCEDCWKKIKFIEKPFCDKCSTPLQEKVSEHDLCAKCLKEHNYFIKARSAVIYNKESAKIILWYKIYDKIHLKKFISKLMFNAAKDIINDIDVFIPVPLHKKRLIFRRYNQALFLAEEIAKLSNKTIIKDFLQRNKYTPPQSKLKRNERIVNLKNKFKINEKYLKAIDNYKNLNFAIVDDVMTTGSTINECIKAMNKCGIKNVYAITFAKTIKDKND